MQRLRSLGHFTEFLTPGLVEQVGGIIDQSDTPSLRNRGIGLIADLTRADDADPLAVRAAATTGAL